MSNYEFFLQGNQREEVITGDAKSVINIGTSWQSPRATFQPLGPFSRKKGLRRETEIPLSIAMMPKGDFETLPSPLPSILSSKTIAVDRP